MRRLNSYFLVAPLLLPACASEPGPATGWQGVVSASNAASSVAASASNPSALVSASASASLPSAGPACSQAIPVTSQLPLLSNLEYENTVTDLFGVSIDVAGMLAPESAGTLDGRSWDAYQRAAKQVSSDVMSRYSSAASLLPCSTEDEACAESIVEQFGKRAFRRPLTDNEKARYLRLYQQRDRLTQGGTFAQAVELILRALIASPSFLVKGELSSTGDNSQRIPLNDWELATRLSYGLTASMPDAELFAAAEAGNLHKPEEVQAQAQRLLQTKRGRAQVNRFHRGFLQMDLGGRWTSDISRDATVYPQFSPAQIPAANTETSLFMDYVTYAHGSYQDLLTKPVAFVNQDLAPLYGLNPANFGTEFVPVELDRTRYAGVLTRIGFLMSHGSASRTNPISRGVFVQKGILCRTMAPPPNGASATPLPDDVTLKTNRARVDAQTAGPTCAGCHHTLINPVGYALENFDSIGAYRTTDNGEAIDSSAVAFVGDEPAPVSGAVDLMQQLAASPAAHSCYVENWFSFAYGRRPAPQDTCAINAASLRIAGGQYSILDLVADLTQTEQFRFRAADLSQETP